MRSSASPICRGRLFGLAILAGFTVWYAVCPVRGEPAAGASPAPSPAPTPYEVRRKSSFDFPPDARNPFWRIGWTRPAPVAPQPVRPQETILDVPADLFRLSSTVLGTPNIAVINGRDYAEGDTIAVTVGNTPVEVRVFRIRDGEVVLAFRGREIRVRMRGR